MCLAATGSARSSGIGVGTPGVGAGSAESESTSELAARFTPGAERGPLHGMASGIVVSGIGLVAGFQNLLAGTVLLALGAILMFAAWGNNTAARRERRKRLRMYEHGWICLQCGASWIPETRP
jgi:hypothetical protein